MPGKFYPVILTILLNFSFFEVFSQSFKQLKDINPGSGGSSYFSFNNMNGVLYFRPDDGIHGAELWKTDGTEAGTVLVKDINPGSAGSDLQECINVNGILYFIANDGVHGKEIWKTDGTLSGTYMIKDIYPGPLGSVSSSLFSANGIIYFEANDGVHGAELWKTDGTPEGTILLKDLYPGLIPGGYSAGIPYNGSPNNFTEINGVVFFNASGGSETHQVWKTDGTVAGTVLVKDIYPGIAGFALTNFVEFKGSLFLTVYGGPDGNELWKSDGTTNGTQLIKKMPGGNFINHATILNGVLYFLEGDGLWKSDGTAAGTVLIKQKENPFAPSPELLTAVNGSLYFTMNDEMHGMEIWISDGTNTGTTLLKDINSGSKSSDINAFTKIGNNLVFSANDGISGNELWISDGTAAGTKLLQDIEPGPASSMPAVSFEIKGAIVQSGNKLYTAAATAALGYEVWVSYSPLTASLPDALLKLTGSIVNDAGYLYWRTENEKNRSVFILERSKDAINFIPIGTVPAAFTVGLHHYNLTDPTIDSLGVPVVYYRLKQEYPGRKFRYSDTVALSIGNKKVIATLYPNPVRTHFNLTITSYQSQKLQWRITDNIGRLIKTGVYSVSIGINRLTEEIGLTGAGVYYFQLYNGNNLQQVIKVIKQ